MRAIPLILLCIPTVLLGQRTVEGNRIVSRALPAAVVNVAKGMTYAGTQAFDLYNVASAEQFFFVELDSTKVKLDTTRVKRFLWIQFEGYKSDNTHTYDYRDSTVSHSGHTWHRRIASTKIPEHELRPDSDGARARAFVREKGWTLGPDVLTERLVWLLDSPARNELMVIYIEDLADQKLTAVDLAPPGKAREQWPAIAAAFHERAVASFRVTN